MYHILYYMITMTLFDNYDLMIYVCWRMMIDCIMFWIGLIQASSMHRSHDYSDGNESYSSRSYGGYESKRMSGGSFGGGGGGEDRRTAMFREERERIRSDNFVFRKPMSAGGPPRHSTPRGTSYRGRVFTRGRSSFRRPASHGSYRGSSDGGFIRKRTLMDRSYGVRKRISTGTTQDYLRRLKMLKIQR